MPRRKARDLQPGDVIACTNDGWYRVAWIEDAGARLYVYGDSDVRDDDLPLMLGHSQVVQVER